MVPPPEPVMPKNGHLRAEHVLGLPVKPPEHGQWAARVIITQATAGWLLKVGSQRQRRITPRKVAHFAILLQDGRFLLTHQGVGVDWDGLVFDGQHRLLAIERTGITTEMWVTFNEDPAIFVALDRAPPRSIADDFHIQGITTERGMALALTAASKMLWDYDNERYPWQKEISPTAIDLFETEARHPHLLEACRVGRDGRRVVPASAFAAWYALMREKSEVEADAFAAKLLRGENIGPTDPAKAVHMFAALHKGHKGSGSFRDEFSVRMVRAWNATRQHKPARRSVQGVLKPGVPFPRVI